MLLPSLTLSGYGLVLEGRREWDAKLNWTTFDQEAARSNQRPAQWGEVTAEVQGNFVDKLDARVIATFFAPQHYGLARYSTVRDGAAGAQELFGSYTFSQKALAVNVNAAYGNQLLRAAPSFVVGGAVSRSFSSFSLGLGHTYRNSPFLNEFRYETHLSMLSTSPFSIQQTLTWRTDPGNTLAYQGSASIPTTFGDFKPGLNMVRDFEKDTFVVGGELSYTKAVNKQLLIGLDVRKDNLLKGPWVVGGSGRYVLDNGSAITASGEVQLGGNQNGAAHVRVAYELPLTVPLSPRTDIGRLAGQLVDEVGQPVSGLLLRLGALKATTDANGRYSFPSVPEGVYYLDIDAGQVGAARVATPSLPERLDIKRTDNLSRNYTLIRAARISGKVTVAAEANTLTNSSVVIRVQDNNALTAGLLVELQSDTGTIYRTLTDSTGNFTFDGLLPGSWSLSIAPGANGKDSPRYNGFTLNIIDSTFNLKPGTIDQAEIRVTPVTRNINIMNGGDLDVLPPPQSAPVEVPKKP